MITSFELVCYIVQEEQRGQNGAAYGAHVLEALSDYLGVEFGRGFSRRNLTSMRVFCLAYRDREPLIWQSSIAKSPVSCDDCPFKLSWMHYQNLMRIENRDERDFYEREAMRENWSVKTLRRQYGLSLYERLALSRDKDEVVRLA